MGKGRWLIGLLLIIGVFTVGRKRIEPLWDKAVDDPAMGIIILLFFLLLVVVIARVIQH